jgi:two-component system response regulator HydG
MREFEAAGFDLVVSNCSIPDKDGLQLFSDLRSHRRLAFILYGRSTSPDVAFRAGREGAQGYLRFPFDVESELIPTIVDALDRVPVAGTDTNSAWPEPIIGRSHELDQIRIEVKKYAPLNISVLVSGETGTGKELVARALHHSGDRSEFCLVKVNCPALPASIVESELFGHEKGAFTGASKRRLGHFENADRGTIFLDEIGELDLLTQAKLLQVLQDGQFQRVGGSGTVHTDVRVIAATNRDLIDEVAAGRFREDLYYRLAQATVHIPPLRDRKEDIRPLAERFVSDFAHLNRRPVPDITAAFHDAMAAQPWIGNVRELKATMQRVMIWWDGKQPLTALCFMRAFTATNGRLNRQDRLLCQRMLEAFSRTGGNQEAARRELQMSRPEWRYRWENKFGLSVLGRRNRTT